MVSIYEIKQSIFDGNLAKADVLRNELKEKKITLVNLMSSPGAGKTSTLKATLPKLEMRVGIMEADIDGDCDAKALESLADKTIQLHTGGMCHLDAAMTRQGLEALDCDDLDLVILENVGNLVCPAEFDTGAHLNVMILSVPEGDDKPLKYPLMFSICDCVLINKMDTLSVFDFDLDKATKWILERNPKATIIPISAKTGQGIDQWVDWLKGKIAHG